MGLNPGVVIRDPEAAAARTYDLILVGGGIYGVLLALEAARKGLRPLLLEREDFGGATSWNSLRIIHGGLRYLQSANLPRFFESVAERRWFLRTFPALVRPLSCLMPLYGWGVRSPLVLQAALLVNHGLSLSRNRGVREDRRLPVGAVIGPQKVRAWFPRVDPRGLTGGAVWWDAAMEDSQRVLMNLLRWACSLGARALNYLEAKEIRHSGRGVAGVAALDRESGQAFEFQSRVVVNAAGPWCRETAARFDRDREELFVPSLAFNVLFDRSSLSEQALAVSTRRKGALVYFLRPWKGKLLVGTSHKPWPVAGDPPVLPRDLLLEFIEELNQAVPGLGLKENETRRIFSGLLPVHRAGSIDLTTRELLIDHGREGGPEGLYSLSGVKFTTARRVAEKTLAAIRSFQGRTRGDGPPDFPPEFLNDLRGVIDYDWHPEPRDSSWLEGLKMVIQEEAVVHLDDLVFRRTGLGDNPVRVREIAPRLISLFPWDPARARRELDRVETKNMDLMGGRPYVEP